MPKPPLLWQHRTWNSGVPSPILSLFPAWASQKHLIPHPWFSHGHSYWGHVREAGWHYLGFRLPSGHSGWGDEEDTSPKLPLLRNTPGQASFGSTSLWSHMGLGMNVTATLHLAFAGWDKLTFWAPVLFPVAGRRKVTRYFLRFRDFRNHSSGGHTGHFKKPFTSAPSVPVSSPWRPLSDTEERTHVWRQHISMTKGYRVNTYRGGLTLKAI